MNDKEKLQKKVEENEKANNEVISMKKKYEDVCKERNKQKRSFEKADRKFTKKLKVSSLSYLQSEKGSNIEKAA